MRVRRTLARARMLVVVPLAAAAFFAASATGPAATMAPPVAARDLAASFFSSTLTRAEVVSVQGRTLHDYHVDEGKVVAVRTGAIDLLERDGTRQTIAVGQGTQVLGLSRLFGQAIRGLRVVTVRDGNGPATQIRPSGSARALGKLLLGATLARAEILTYSNKTLHDIRIDDGRIVGKGPTSLTLLELDGTRQTITLGPQTQFVGIGGLTGIPLGARGVRVVTLTDNGGPATLVRPATTAKALGKSLFGSALVRAEIVTYAGKTQDVRVDEGRIVAVRGGSITLLERDGTRQAIAVAATATVTEGGQTVDSSAIVRGLTALTVRINDAPAQQIFLAAGVLGVGK